MNAADFSFFARLVKEGSGLAMTEDKSYLVETRLLSVAQRHGHASVAALAWALKKHRDTGLVREIVEAMTTNESSFFRDMKPFEQFRTLVLPALLKARAASRTLRFWSAACAAGQEPYSLAMLLDEERVRLAGWHVSLLATDISGEMIERAKAGNYSQFEVQRGLPLKYVVRHLEPEADRWQVKPALRAMVEFRVMNLLDDFSALGPFDMILCRNVLLYFDRPTKAALLERLARQLRPDGFFILGGAETMIGMSERFEPVPQQHGLYRLAPPAYALATSASGTN
ncbi:MAG TPA: protein-glutamate O-methyltransferase CheR [Stellaceae bacterium]|nr:protein-glutamate O-methyltransferase CheR [Stellaceae bacterium]